MDNELESTAAAIAIAIIVLNLKGGKQKNLKEIGLLR